MRGSKTGKVYGHLNIPRLPIDQMNRPLRVGMHVWS
jgi:hypothetical protein